MAHPASSLDDLIFSCKIMVPVDDINASRIGSRGNGLAVPENMFRSTSDFRFYRFTRLKTIADNRQDCRTFCRLPIFSVNILATCPVDSLMICFWIYPES